MKKLIIKNYFIDEQGNVYVNDKKLKPQVDKNGYLWVNLNYDGKQHNHKIHRLVAQAFIPNPDNLQQINHKDEDKTNNRVENLEWCTNDYNIHYGTAIKRATQKRKENGFYWMEDAMKKRKQNNPNNEMWYKIAQIKKANGTDKQEKLMIPVIQLTLDGEFVKEYQSVTDAANAVGCERSNIRACCKGKQKTAKNYKWIYKTDYYGMGKLKKSA